MKKIKNVIFVLVAVLFFDVTINAQASNIQNHELITGVFDGFDGENFTFNYINEENEEDVIFFPRINTEVLQKYDLNEEKYIGKTFKITFVLESETEIDEDGDEQEYITGTIIDLELLE